MALAVVPVDRRRSMRRRFLPGVPDGRSQRRVGSAPFPVADRRPDTAPVMRIEPTIRRSDAYAASVQATASDAYVAAFVARCSAMGQPLLNKPGVHGVLSSADHPLTRLLITDDQANDELAVQLPAARAGIINVFVAAPRCAELVDGHLGWRAKAATAMICRDLRNVPELALPNELTLRPVRRLPRDAPDGVPLEDAAAVAVLSSRSLAPPIVTDLGPRLVRT